MGARFDLTGKAAIVTGSTRGIGRAIASALREAGAQVMISSEDDADTRRVASELNQPGFAADVTDDAAMTALVNATISAFGGLDILVCNVGAAGKPGPFAGVDMGDFDRIMRLNLRSQVVLANLALPHIAARGGGAAILMSSISALRGNAAINAYALSKCRRFSTRAQSRGRVGPQQRSRKRDRTRVYPHRTFSAAISR